MPNKIKSGKQFRMMEAAAHGANYGPSKKVAKELLAGEGHKKRVKLAKMK